MFNNWIKLLILSHYNTTFLLNSNKVYNINYKTTNIIKFLFINKKKINIIKINYINKCCSFIIFLLKFKSIKVNSQLQLKLLYKNLYPTKVKSLINYNFNKLITSINKKYHTYLNINQYKKNYFYIYPIKKKSLFKLNKFILNLYYKKKSIHKKKIINSYKIPVTYKKFLISVKNIYVYKLFKYTNLFGFYLNTMLNNFFFKYKKKKKINKYVGIRKYFSYKIKLKPGFSTLWRLFRQKCKTIYNLKFTFQHSLTKYINIVSSIRVYYKLLYWFGNLNKIFTVNFIKLNANLYIYINGIKLIYTSHLIHNFFKKKKLSLTYLCIGDCLQLPYSYKFLLFYKNMCIFNVLLFTQYDISSLSIIYLYHNTLLVNWGYNHKYSHNLFSFKMYNWKYIT